MKKIFFCFLGVLLFFPFFQGEAQDDAPKTEAGYGLKQALESLDAYEEDGETLILPQHLAGVDSELSGTADDVTLYLQRIINGVAGIAATLAVAFLVVNAFALVTATGGSDKIAKAKKGVIWSLVGLLLIIGSYVVVKTIIALTYSGEISMKEEEKRRQTERREGGGGGRISETELRARDAIQRHNEAESLRQQYRNPGGGGNENSPFGGGFGFFFCSSIVSIEENELGTQRTEINPVQSTRLNQQQIFLNRTPMGTLRHDKKGEGIPQRGTGNQMTKNGVVPLCKGRYAGGGEGFFSEPPSPHEIPTSRDYFTG
ncbi:pilin [Candidatus Gracilibacteria bacterium]|nr:pilin [Candidatus Gracilibacteria bacterium]